MPLDGRSVRVPPPLVHRSLSLVVACWGATHDCRGAPLCIALPRRWLAVTRSRFRHDIRSVLNQVMSELLIAPSTLLEFEVSLRPAVETMETLPEEEPWQNKVGQLAEHIAVVFHDKVRGSLGVSVRSTGKL